MEAEFEWGWVALNISQKHDMFKTRHRSQVSLIGRPKVNKVKMFLRSLDDLKYQKATPSWVLKTHSEEAYKSK